jgi:hypothetical protein
MTIHTLLKDFAVFWGFRAPDPEPTYTALLEAELAAAERSLLKALSASEHASAMVVIYQMRVNRLQESLQ